MICLLCPAPPNPGFVVVVVRFHPGKMFHIKCMDQEVAIKVEHGSFVVMHQLGGGVNATVSHGGMGDAGQSYIFIMETSFGG